MEARTLFVVATAIAMMVAGLGPTATAEHGSDPIVVCTAPGPDCDETSIQAAEAHAGAGDTIVVRPGVYGEAIEVETAGLTLCGTGPAGTSCGASTAGAVVDASGEAETVLAVDAPDVTVESLALTWDGVPDGPIVHGVLVTETADRFTLRESTVELPAMKIGVDEGGLDTGKPNTRGVQVVKAAGASIVDNRVVAEPVDVETQRVLGGQGINLLRTPSDSEVHGNVVAGWTQGLMLRASGALVEANTFAGNLRGIQITPLADAAEIRANTFEANVAAVWDHGTDQSITLRANHFGLSNGLAIQIRDKASGNTLDARENYWGVAGCVAIEQRILDPDGDNTVRIAPYTGPAGESTTSDPTC